MAGKILSYKNDCVINTIYFESKQPNKEILSKAIQSLKRIQGYTYIEISYNTQIESRIKNKTLTPVVQMDSNKNVIAVFENIQHASEKTFISRNMIYQSIRRKRGIMEKQYYFKYFE